MKKVESRNYVRIAILAIYGLNFGFYLAIFNPLADTIFGNVYQLNKEQSN